MSNKKQYGLILPKKYPLSTPKVGNVFGSDDDSEEEQGTDWVKKALVAENEKNKIKKQTQVNMQKALKQDPTIFQYDEVYDKIERIKEEEKSFKKVEQKAKYIDNLLKTADLRKKEQELRKDRIIQKEIEAEDAMFPDKERYVTSSYKAKLEEMKKFEEEQQNQDRLEAIGDVTKQNDMSGFYRHLYRQTVDRNAADLGISHKVEKPKGKINKCIKVQPDIDRDDPIISNSDSEESGKSDFSNERPKSSAIVKISKKRQYRKRTEEASEPETDEESKKDDENTIDEKKVDIAEDSTKSKKPKLLDNIENNVEEEKNKPLKNNVSKETVKSVEKPIGESPVKNGTTETAEEKPKPQEVKKKINIWLKRTIGQVFDEALQRYLIRKQERLSGYNKDSLTV